MITPEKKVKVITAVLNGMAEREAESKYGVTRKTIRKWVHSEGGKLIASTRPKEPLEVDAVPMDLEDYAKDENGNETPVDDYDFAGLLGRVGTNLESASAAMLTIVESEHMATKFRVAAGRAISDLNGKLAAVAAMVGGNADIAQAGGERTEADMCKLIAEGKG